MSVDISVIIPVYNAEKTLGRCIDSVLRQKPSLEVILIDDYSADSSLQVCKELSLIHISEPTRRS